MAFDLSLLNFDFGVLGLAGVELVHLLSLTTYDLNGPSHVAVGLELESCPSLGERCCDWQVSSC